MNNQVANEDGKFKYPDGNYYYQHSTGNPAWDINDYCYTEKEYIGFDEKLKSKNATLYTGVDQYAKDNNLRVDKYNQIQPNKIIVKKV